MREIEGEVGDGRRRSKDEIISKNGRMLVGFMEKRGWMVLNGG